LIQINGSLWSSSGSFATLAAIRRGSFAGLGIKHDCRHLYQEGPLGGGHEALAAHIRNFRRHRRLRCGRWSPWIPLSYDGSRSTKHHMLFAGARSGSMPISAAMIALMSSNSVAGIPFPMRPSTITLASACVARQTLARCRSRCASTAGVTVTHAERCRDQRAVEIAVISNRLSINTQIGRVCRFGFQIRCDSGFQIGGDRRFQIGTRCRFQIRRLCGFATSPR
jgi:hypothetical protein